MHGLWPTQVHRVGPSYCNHSAHFDAEALERAGLMPRLEARWTNVHKNSDRFGFWKHEWEKHGTCAADNPDLDSEVKYFSMGLKLNEEFPLAQWLKAYNWTRVR